MTSGEYFKSLRIIHAALTIGVAFFTLVSIFIQMKGFKSIDSHAKLIFLFIVPSLALAGIISSNFVFKKRITKIKYQLDLKGKMDQYRSAVIIKLALIEAPAFFTVITFLLTGDYLFIGIAFLLIIVFLLYTPTKAKFTKELELKISEIEIINNPQSTIQ